MYKEATATSDTHGLLYFYVTAYVRGAKCIICVSECNYAALETIDELAGGRVRNFRPASGRRLFPALSLASLVIRRWIDTRV